jgi:MFS family permease
VISSIHTVAAESGTVFFQFSTFGSILNVGCMLGAILSGKIADYLGRKHALLVAVVPELVGWILIVFGQNPISLIIARFLVGLGGGIISFTVPMYIGEIAPKHMRGGLGTMNQFAITVGITLSYLLGIWVNWRMLALLGALPEIILIFGLFLIPESPRWLAKAAHKEELTSSLQKLRGKDFNISHEISDIQAAVEASNSLPAVKWGDLMQPKLFRPLIVSGSFFYYCCLLIISMPAFPCGLIGKVINVPCFHVSFQRYIFFHCSRSFERAILLLSLLISFQSVLSLYHSIEVFSSIIMFFCLSKVVPLVQFYAFKRLLWSRISVWCFLPLESLT